MSTFYGGHGRERSKYLTRSIENNRPRRADTRGRIKEYEPPDLDKDILDLDVFRRIRNGGLLGLDGATPGATPGA